MDWIKIIATAGPLLGVVGYFAWQWWKKRKPKQPSPDIHDFAAESDPLEDAATYVSLLLEYCDDYECPEAAKALREQVWPNLLPNISKRGAE